MTIVCSACSDIVVHGKTSTLHTEECRNRIGEQMKHDPEGHERLHAHQRRRDVEFEVEANWAPVVLLCGVCVCETICKTFWNRQPKTRARLEPRRGQKRESTQLQVTSSVSDEDMVQNQCSYFCECWNPTRQLWYSWITLLQ